VDTAFDTFSDWLGWALALAVGFPLVLVVLNELILRLERAGRPIASTLRSLRNLVLPTLALMLFLRFVVQRPANDTPVRLVQTALFILLLYVALSFVNVVVFRSARAGSWQSRVPDLIRDLARAILVAIGAGIIYSQVWGKELGGLLTAFGVGSIVIGLALQEPLGNFVSGLMLLMERPLSIGDWVTVEGTTGQVIDINWRSVHIRTRTYELRVVPNSSLHKGSFTNRTRLTEFRTEYIELQFSYDDPPNKVKEMLLDLLRSTPGVLALPEPRVRTRSYADFAIVYRVRFTTRGEDLGDVRDAFMTRLWYAVRRHGLSIPFPTATRIEVDQRTLEASRAVRPLDALLEFPQFKLQNGGTEGVSPGLSVQSFAAGEPVIAQGQRVEGLHLVLRGEALLTVQDVSGEQHEIARAGRGEFFGEGAILAAQASDLAVTALTDMDVLILDLEAVQRLLEGTPRLAREIGNVLDVRRKAVRSARVMRSG
jgi:small-conductance mechanosensitive channel